MIEKNPLDSTRIDGSVTFIILSRLLNAIVPCNILGPFYQARVIIDPKIKYNSDPLQINSNFRSVMILRFMKILFQLIKLQLILSS